MKAARPHSSIFYMAICKNIKQESFFTTRCYPADYLITHSGYQPINTIAQGT